MVELRVLALVGLLVVTILSVVTVVAAATVAERLRPVWTRLRGHRPRPREAAGRLSC